MAPPRTEKARPAAPVPVGGASEVAAPVVEQPEAADVDAMGAAPPSLPRRLSQPLAPPALPVVQAYPGLAEVPRLALMAGPTPVQRLRRLEGAAGVQAELYVKRDDLTSPVYGGNKVRKLEFTLGELQKNPPSRIIVAGGLGSNLCVATAAFGKQVGIPVKTLLFNQPIDDHVRENMRLDAYYGAEIEPAGGQVAWGWSLFWESVMAWFANLFGTGPHVMWPGDSNALSGLGYVNAAFELRAQIHRGEVPEPDYIYVAAGSCGTMAALMAGLRLAGLKTKVVGVQVTNGMFCNESEVAGLANATLKLVEERSGMNLDVPRFDAADVRMEHDFYGEGYGEPLPAGEDAKALVGKSEGLGLDSTYTGKAMAAMLAFAKTPAAKGKRVMFLNTLSSRDLSREAASVDVTQLPEDVRRRVDPSFQLPKPKPIRRFGS